MATGSYRIDAFLSGEHFTVMVKKGQMPANAVAYALARRFGCDRSGINLWPKGQTPAGQEYRASWFDPKSERFREATVEIWNRYRSGNYRSKR